MAEDTTSRTEADAAWWERRLHGDEPTREQLRAEADYDPADWTEEKL